MTKQEEKIVKAGGIKVQPVGCREAYQIGSKLLWLGVGNGKQVMVGYAHTPQEQGTLMSLKSALELY